MAPSSALAANEAPESVIPELIEASRPKQSRAVPRRVTKRAAKPPKPLSANKLQKEMDKEGMLHLAWRRQQIMAKEAAEMVAAQPVYGAPGQLYGQNQSGQIYGQNAFQAAPGFSPPAPGFYPQTLGFNPPAQSSYYQAAGPFPQQPPYLPPLAPHLAPAPAPAPSYSHGHGRPSPRPSMELWPVNPPLSFVMQQPQNMYQQHPNGYNFF
ncbi:hypothetical protein FAGAP_12368 [Fusarium agapanthi]|uniref:Uncharacterized protein n=1 Tax=Fusarium agapanthi TaxID=1803897 RepID=A0A9P5AY73_9HYPO|nr:hypothetical protein FAGAP_12368 [Fusarium agapanthi]